MRQAESFVVHMLRKIVKYTLRTLIVILLAVLLCAGIIVTRVRKNQLFDDGGCYFRPNIP